MVSDTKKAKASHAMASTFSLVSGLIALAIDNAPMYIASLIALQFSFSWKEVPHWSWVLDHPVNS